MTSSSGGKGGGGKMSSLDLQLCRDAVKNLTSSENSSKNYLFLEPVDLTFFPDYTQIISRPMDLGTLSKNLDNGVYSSREEFFADANLCFENAQKYHVGKKDSAWILKLAKDMMKLVKKERKRAENRANKIAGGGSSGGGGGDGGGGGGDGRLSSPTPQYSSSSSSKKSSEKRSKSKKDRGDQSKDGSSGGGGSEKRPVLKLKLSHKKMASSSSLDVPKSSSKQTEVGGGSGSGSGSSNPMDKMDKIPKIKLSSKKSSSDSNRGKEKDGGGGIKLKLSSQKNKKQNDSSDEEGEIEEKIAEKKPKIKLSASSGGGGGSSEKGKKEEKQKIRLSTSSSGSDKDRKKEEKQKIRLSTGGGGGDKGKKEEKQKIRLSTGGGGSDKGKKEEKTKIKLSASSGSEKGKKEEKSKIKLSAGSSDKGKKDEKPKIKLSGSGSSDKGKKEEKGKLKMSASGSSDKGKKDEKTKLKLSSGSSSSSSIPKKERKQQHDSDSKSPKKKSSVSSPKYSSSDGPTPSSPHRKSISSTSSSSTKDKTSSSSTLKISNKSSSKKKDKQEKIKAVKAKPSKPKLKLTLSLSKKAKKLNLSSSAPSQKEDTTKSSSAGSSSKSSDKKDRSSSSSTSADTSKKSTSQETKPTTTTIKVNAHPPSRGKELPKAVAEQKSAAAAAAATTPTSSTKASSSSSTPKSSSSTKQSKQQSSSKKSSSSNEDSIVAARLSAPSRGKELPKGVTVDSNKESQKSSSSSSKSKKSSSKQVSSATSSGGSKQKQSTQSTQSKSNAKSPQPPSTTPPKPSSTKTTAPASQKPPTPKRNALATQPKPSAAVAAAAPPPQQQLTLKPPPTAAPQLPVVKVAVLPMNPLLKASCSKILSALKRRQAKDAKWFLKPVSDKGLVEDYRAKIPHPIDLGTMTTKLDRNDYPTCANFVLDLRRIFGNCLRFNTSINDEFRSIAIDMISYTEDYLKFFVEPNTNGIVAYPRLLYCWKLCLTILDELISMKNPGDGHQTVHYFLHPVSFYCGGEFPPGYVEKVKTPMDLGTVTSKLIEGIYQSVGAFVADCRRVVENCRSFYGGREDGAAFVEQAVRLEGFMAQHLGALMRYDQSPEGSKAKAVALTTRTIGIDKPSKDFLLSMLNDLRGTKYTDRYTKLTESATAPFEKPVNVAVFTDYTQFVDSPMDLETVERKIQNDSYRTAEDFEYDISLIFRNCERYNIPKKNDHIVSLAKHAAKMFRRLFSARMKVLESGGNSSSGGGNDSTVTSDATEMETPPKKKNEVTEKKGTAKRALSPRRDGERPSKKTKTEGSSNAKVRSSMEQQGGKNFSRSKSSKSSSSGSTKKKIVSRSAAADDGPVPLHVAISQVKDNFPTRRPYKLLQSWEGACSRFFRELMKHPWISAARPRFIFHVPVPVIFPELKDAYAAKIEKPMDLTTAEAKLLQGGIYENAQDFVDDVALVFANAVTFNQAGHDEGEPMSCAYYDAARHLLKYTRWLSLEYLSPYLVDDSQDSDSEKVDGPVPSWKLTTSNRKTARLEMEKTMMKEPIEKSEEGDRYNWMETECEKLLKALRLQSDLRYMTYFIQPNYPADYFAYISKPMDWERCQQNLQKRSYDTFGDIVEDLRLIFSNALKYNARAKGTDTVSGHAYEAAIYMSKKLEAAIDKMLLAVSERLGRERIEVITAEREHEAAERAEEERLRAAWQKEREKARASSVEVKTRVETVETVKVIHRRLPQRKEMMDFEFPFYDEDDSHHEQSHMEALRQAKIMFEKQQKNRKAMRKITHSVGMSVFAKMIEQAQALDWAKEMDKSIIKGKNLKPKEVVSCRETKLVHAKAMPEPTKVSTKMRNKERGQIKMSLCKRKSSKKRKAPSCIFD